MRKFLLNPMILTFHTDIPIFQTKFFRSDYCVMGLEFCGQKVCVFLLIPRGPRANKHIITQNDWTAESQKKVQNSWFCLNVARATRNTFAGQMWPAGRVMFVTPDLEYFQSSGSQMWRTLFGLIYAMCNPYVVSSAPFAHVFELAPCRSFSDPSRVSCAAAMFV